jgi:hypothetical protein
MSISNATDSIAGETDYIGDVNTLKSKALSLLHEISSEMKVMQEQPVISIHEIRKRTKFIRAILRLDLQLQMPLSPPMKTLSAGLAPYRDAQVNLETYWLLIEKDPQFQCQDLLEFLKQSPYLIPPNPDHSSMATLQTLLMNAKEALQNTSPSRQLLDRLKIIDQGFNNFKRITRAMQISSGMETVHKWRKMTKRLMYQMRLIFGDVEQREDHLLSRFDLLGKHLGEIHDRDILGEIAAELVPVTWLEAHQALRTESLAAAIAAGQTISQTSSEDFIQLITLELESH